MKLLQTYVTLRFKIGLTVEIENKYCTSVQCLLYMKLLHLLLTKDNCSKFWTSTAVSSLHIVTV